MRSLYERTTEEILMNQSAVTQWLFGELRQVLADTTGTGVTDISDAQNNVDVADPSIDHPYPFIGVQAIASNPQSKGIGNGQLVTTGEQYVDGVVDEIDHERDTELRVSLIPVTDNNVKLRDDLTDALANHFALVSKKDEHPDDLTIQQIGESSPQGRTDEFVRSSGVPLVVEYTTNVTDDNPEAAEAVDMNIDVADGENMDATATDDDLNRTFN